MREPWEDWKLTRIMLIPLLPERLLMATMMAAILHDFVTGTNAATLGIVFGALICARQLK